RGEENTQIRGNPSQNEPFHVKMIEKRCQRTLEESGMHRLQNEVVVLARFQSTRHLAPRGTPSRAMLVDFGKVAAPVPEVVVYVNYRDARPMRPGPERRKFRRQLLGPR